MVSKLALLALHLLGWKLIGQRPPFKKYVLVGAPHTSNMDFLFFYLGVLAMGLKASFLAKKSVFWEPLGTILRMMGGIPVVRDKHTNMVDQMVQVFDERDELILLVPPSGTRRKTDYWKSGFYYIALGAKVPLVLATMDYKAREVGISHWFMPSGDIKKDMDVIRSVYEPITPKFPNEKSAIRLRQEDKPAGVETPPQPVSDGVAMSMSE